MKKVRWQDLTYTLYTNPHHYFLVMGPWDDPLLIDHPVQNMWGSGGDLGLSLVYEKGVEFRWVVLNKDTGEKALGGLLFYMGPDTGYVQSVFMRSLQNGFTVKVSFDTGSFTVYQIDSHGNKTVLKQGKTP